MARRLINQYGYSKENVKVLLGGWSAWQENNTKDSKGYPITITEGSAPVNGKPPDGVILTPDTGGSKEGTPGRRVILVTTPQP